MRNEEQMEEHSSMDRLAMNAGEEGAKFTLMNELL